MQTVSRERETQRGPTRTCVGCGRQDVASALVRLVLGPVLDDGSHDVAVDALGAPSKRRFSGSLGRGAHVHPRPDCLAKACRGGIARAFRCRVRATAEGLAQQMIQARDRRVAGLLVGARRSSNLVIGADAVLEALQAEGAEASLLVVASDAGTVIGKAAIASAIQAGRAVAWNTKQGLGALLGRNEVAVCMVTSPSIAQAVRETFKLAASVAGRAS